MSNTLQLQLMHGTNSEHVCFGTANYMYTSECQRGVVVAQCLSSLNWYGEQAGARTRWYQQKRTTKISHLYRIRPNCFCINDSQDGDKINEMVQTSTILAWLCKSVNPRSFCGGMLWLGIGWTGSIGLAAGGKREQPARTGPARGQRETSSRRCWNESCCINDDEWQRGREQWTNWFETSSGRACE